MAEPVIVPIQLEVTDIDMSNINLTDVRKDISKQMSGIRKSMTDTFKGIDASAINKPIEAAMTSVKKSVQAAEDAQIRYNEALIKAGASTEEYKSAVASAKSAISSQQALINELSELGPAVAPHLAEAKKELETLVEARNKINPLDFVDKAQPIQLEKIANAYQKVLNATNSVNKQTEKFNQTVQDNKLTNEYAEMLKQAEAYKKKLEELNDKSKRMEALGATDRQWEALRYDTEQVSNEMDKVIKKMREAVTTGKAFRFGEGNKGELSRQINSLSMSAGNRAGNIRGRANANSSPYAEDYQKSLDELDKLEKKIEAIKEKSAKMVELGASKKQFESLAYDAEQLDVKVDEVKNHLMGMVNEGGAFKFNTGDADAEITKIRDKSNSLQSTLTGVSTTAKQAQGGLAALGATHPKLAAVLTVAGKIGQGLGKVLQVAGKVGKAIVTGFTGAVRVLGKVGSAISRVASGFTRMAKGIFSGIRNMNIFGKTGHKTTNDMNTRVKKLTKNILMWGFGFRTAYYAIKRLRNIFVEGFKVMGEQFDEVGQPMARMMESFNRLKGSLATAFQPLVSVVMPILTRFMNYLSGVLEGIGKFMATLTGQGHIYKAVAKNIDSVAASAKEANKQLGSYDKLEVIQKDTGAGYEYEKQDISATESAASSFADMVKKAWEKADFTSVGVYVTEQLLAVLDKVEKNILPKVTAFVNKVLKSINTFFDGFDSLAIGDKVGSLVNTLIYGIEWEQVGMLFANLNNVIWEFFDGLANSIDWTAAGQALADGISGMFSILNLDAWIGMMSGFTNGITQAFLTVLTQVDWAAISVKLGTAVNNLFTSVDLAKIGTTVHTLFETIWAFVGDFFATVDFEMIASTIATGINNIFNGGSPSFDSAIPNVAKGLVTFFTTAIANIDWKLIINTLLSGVRTVLQSLRDEMVKSDNPIISSFGEIVGTIIKTIDAIKPAVETILRSIDPVVKSVLPVINKLLPPIAKILATVVDIVLPPLVRLFEALMPILVRLVEAILPNIERQFTLLAKAIGVVADILTDIFVPIVDMAVGIIEGLEGTVTVFAKVFKGEIGSLKGLFTELFRVWKTPLNNIIGAFESLVNGIVKGVNIMIRALNKLSFDVPDWVPSIGGKKFGFNLKEISTVKIPRLAQGAVIPPNKEFLAMLGDQTHGTNIEAPLDTIKQALAEVLAEIGGGNREPIILQVNGRTLAKVVWDEQEKRYKQTGRYAMA